MSPGASTAFREVTAERADEYVAKGHKRRRFFPHRVYHLPKCGPDGFKHAVRMCDRSDPAMMRQILLFAGPPALGAFPPELFFDDDLNWHRQHFGRPGQVASANVVLDGTTVYSMGHLSDFVQRISRRRDQKTKVSKLFRGWSHMLLNAVLVFAAEHGARRVCTPTAELAMRNTDRKRRHGLGPELFERVYDWTVTDLFPAQRDGEWWVMEVAPARERILMPERRTETRRRSRTICICHEISSLGHLEEIRRLQAQCGVRATYLVAGSLLSELRDRLEADGHALAFHSFDHRLDREDQLERCREVDYRIKGYRPPYSRITAELSDHNLLFHNFEWLASSPSSLGVTAPVMRAGVVRMPIALDDSPMHERAMRYEEWERLALRLVAGSDFAAISLRERHALQWLPHYQGFLERLREIGDPRTLDDAAAEVTLCSAS